MNITAINPASAATSTAREALITDIQPLMPQAHEYFFFNPGQEAQAYRKGIPHQQRWNCNDQNEMNSFNIVDKPEIFCKNVDKKGIQ